MACGHKAGISKWSTTRLHRGAGTIPVYFGGEFSKTTRSTNQGYHVPFILMLQERGSCKNICSDLCIFA